MTTPPKPPTAVHLAASELEALVQRTVPRAQAFLWLLHLGLCRSCRRRLETSHGARGRRFLREALPRGGRGLACFQAPATRPADYVEAVDKALAAASRIERQVLKEEEEAASLYRRLAEQPPGRWRLVVHNQPRYQTLGMLSLVLREANRARRPDPRRAEHLARLALEIHPQLDAAVYGARLLRDRGAMAWGYLASALRAQGRLLEADQALREGEGLLPEDPREALDETAWLRLFRASVSRDRGHFETALEAAREARGLFQILGDRPHTAWTEVLTAELLADLGHEEKALTDLGRFLEEASREEVGDPVYLAAVQHLITSLARAGRGQEAYGWLGALDEVSAAFPEPRNQACILWTKGLVYEALDELEASARILRRVRGALIDHGFAFLAALASLDLAAVLLDLGRSSEVLPLAEEMVPILQSVRVERKTLAAVLVFVESLRREQATSEAARALARKLKQTTR